MSEYINAWASLYHRRISTEAIEKWLEIFGHVPPALLKEALEKVTTESERFPAPGNLTRALNLVREKHPPRMASLTLGKLQRDAQGDPCRKDLATGELLYRAVDCKEGRLFLLKLARFTGKPREELLKLWEKWNGVKEIPK